MPLLRKPVFWVVLLVLAWITLVTVQIALGMGTAPTTNGPNSPAGR
jgi:hypothetical protein